MPDQTRLETFQQKPGEFYKNFIIKRKILVRPISYFLFHQNYIKPDGNFYGLIKANQVTLVFYIAFKK